MARTESRTKTAIWSDPDFRKLSGSAQRMYWLLYSQPTISLCGIVALTVKRWAAMCSDDTPESVVLRLGELEEAEFIVVDMHTEEVWVRSFVAHDGVGNSPKTLAAAYRQLPSIASTKLRKLAEDALRVIGPPPPEPKSAKPQVNTLYRNQEYAISPVENSQSLDENTSSVRAGAVSSLRPPSPDSSLRPPAEDEDLVLRTDSTKDRLADRMADACTADRKVTWHEARLVVAWASRAVDVKLIEEAIGWAEARKAGDQPIRLPRGIAKTIRSKAADHNIALPEFDPTLRVVGGAA